MSRYKVSDELFEKALQAIPGGVNSPVRAFKNVGKNPLFIKNGSGSHITDVDGNEYIDYVCSWGPLILGHSHPEVITEIRREIENGISFGAPCLKELELSEFIVKAVPSIENIRLVNSGTEATMSALRLARAFTGRDKIIKFSGCYHGHADGLLVKAGSGVATAGLPDSPGVPKSYTKHTLIAPYNNLKATTELFEHYPGSIAAIIVEPVAANMGVVKPEPGFLEGLRQLATAYGAVLIFDEVITGFRLSFGGAQQATGVIPDLTCLGKIIGGGLPVGAYGGKKEIMQMVAPQGAVYQAGTLSGNPVAATAGLATLKVLAQKGIYEELQQKTDRLEEGINNLLRQTSGEFCLNRIGSLLTLFFTLKKVNDFESASSSNMHSFMGFHQSLLGQGIYWPPSQFEAAFISLALTNEDIDKTLRAMEKALAFA